MELRMYCAYNQTRECFLGLEVTTGDFSYHALSREGALTIKPNEGLWLTPFRGLPESGVTAPVDLIYLDKDCRVIDLVESFPGSRPTYSTSTPESLLVLPAHSIFLSETKVDDQFVLCVAEEMQRRLERLSGKETEAGGMPRTSFAIAKPADSACSGIPAVESQSEGVGQRTDPIRENAMPNPAKGRFGSPKSWLQRLWSLPEHRRSPRKAAPGLAAYYWNGLPPAAHDVRDISSTGLYLLTEDRWYPGTMVLMTLQDKDGPDNSEEDAIAVNVRAVRRGNDGVGLEFVVTDGRNSKDLYVKESDRKKLERFLQRLKR